MEKRTGFTLVELMIVVAIIGILAAIAVPNFVAMQHRAKRAELPLNVDGIKDAEVAYEAAFDTYVTQFSYQPDNDVGKAPRPWKMGSAFDTLGWAPDGDVRGKYQVIGNSTAFTIMGRCDVDGDGDQAGYNADNTANAFMWTDSDVY